MLSTGDRIVQSSLRLFAKKGFEATSIRDIALEAGVNSSTLYYYINNKEDFLTKILKRGLERTINGANTALSNLKSSEERIATLVKLHVYIHGRNQLSSLVSDTEYRSLHGKNKQLIKELRKKYELIWFEIINTGTKEGKFTNVREPKMTTYAVMAMCTGVVHWYSPKGKLSLDEISDEFVDMVLNLLGAKISVKDLDLPDPQKYYNPDNNDYISYLEVSK